MNLIIRNIELKDIRGAATIKVRGWQEAYKDILDKEYLDSLDITQKESNMLSNYKENGFIVAELENRIVGFSRYIDNNSMSTEISEADCELLALYVEPKLKRQWNRQKFDEIYRK